MPELKNDKTPIDIKKNDDVIEIPLGKFIGNVRSNPWSASTIILAAILIAVLVFNYPGSVSVSKVAPSIAGQNALAFIQSNPSLEGEVSLVSVQESSGFYEVMLNYQGNLAFKTWR